MFGVHNPKNNNFSNQDHFDNLEGQLHIHVQRIEHMPGVLDRSNHELGNDELARGVLERECRKLDRSG